MELDCLLEHKGFPQAEAAVWLKDGIRLKDQSGLGIRVENAGVETDRKYTCIPFNKVITTNLAISGLEIFQQISLKQ